MAKSKRQLVLFCPAAAGGGPTAGGAGAGVPLGSPREVIDALASFNTSPDKPGDGDFGLLRLFGPGLVVELPTSSDEVLQAMVTITDEEYAFPVLMRLCARLGWKMMDADSGRTFG